MTVVVCNSIKKFNNHPTMTCNVEAKLKYDLTITIALTAFFFAGFVTGYMADLSHLAEDFKMFQIFH